MNHHDDGNGVYLERISTLPFAAVIVIYIALAIASGQRYKPFPWHRYFCWIFGVLGAAVSAVGPLASRAHTDFAAHMMVHLLLGMLAPLFLVLAAPMTLLMRTLGLNQARGLSRILKSAPFRLLNDPLAASILNIGGLWVLYTTDLYNLMQQNLLLHILVHIHIFVAGYLFTASLISIDPASHRTSFGYRTVTLLLASSGHAILSKYIYSNPPSGVPSAQAASGSMIMYYGGDIVDIFLISILFLQRFNATRPQAPPFVNKI